MDGFKCSCGGKLRLIELVTYEKAQRINVDGTMTKRKTKAYPSHVDLVSMLSIGSCIGEYLNCINCDTKYEFLGLDDTGKIIKGEIIPY